MKTLKVAREQAGLRQDDLARILGMKQSQISRIESGLRETTEEERMKIAKAVGVSPKELLMSSSEALGAMERMILTSASSEQRKVAATMLRELFG